MIGVAIPRNLTIGSTTITGYSEHMFVSRVPGLNRHTYTLHMHSVSIVIPCFKQAHFLGAAIDSCLAQDYPHVEVIVINDGSPDHTRDIAAAYGDRIVYVEHPVNRGLSAARNSGIARATGDFIAFLDSDDLMLPGRLRIQAEALAQSVNIGLCACGLKFIDETGAPLDESYQRHQPPRNKSNFRWEVTTYQVLPSQAMVRKACFMQLGGFDERLRGANGEDWLMWVILSSTYDMVYVDQPLVAYRRHSQQVTASNAERLAPQNRLASQIAVESELFPMYPAQFRAQLLIYRFATTWREESKVYSLAFLWRALLTAPSQFPYAMKVIGQGIRNTIARRRASP